MLRHRGAYILLPDGLVCNTPIPAVQLASSNRRHWDRAPLGRVRGNSLYLGVEADKGLVGEAISSFVDAPRPAARESIEYLDSEPWSLPALRDLAHPQPS